MSERGPKRSVPRVVHSIGYVLLPLGFAGLLTAGASSFDSGPVACPKGAVWGSCEALCAASDIAATAPELALGSVVGAALGGLAISIKIDAPSGSTGFYPGPGESVGGELVDLEQARRLRRQPEEPDLGQGVA